MVAKRLKSLMRFLSGGVQWQVHGRAFQYRFLSHCPQLWNRPGNTVKPDGASYEVPRRLAGRSRLCNEGQLTEAVEALDLLVQQSCHVAQSIFYSVLRRCIFQKDLVLGSRVHALAVRSGHESNPFLANHIIGMYGSHGKLEEAMQVFTKVRTPNRHMWASIILAHARSGQPAEAAKLYRSLRASTLEPHDHIFVAALKASAAAEDLGFGKEVHADILRTARAPNKFVGAGLVNMYSKCGSLENARRVFDSLTQTDVVTWTAMITGYAQHGQGEEALSLYASMQQEGISPANHVTFVSLLQACASVGATSLHQGKQLHVQVQEKGLECDVIVGTCLVDMYAKCGSLEDARKVFDTLPKKNVVTWNAIISGYAQSGRGQEALALYRNMQLEGEAQADAATYFGLLQACGSIAGLEEGKEIHDEIAKRRLEATHMFLASSLIDMYGKCGSMIDAQQVFDAMLTKDSVTWTALMAGYARLGESDMVFDLLERMRQDGFQPDGITFLTVLTVCSHVGMVERGQKYFEEMRKEHNITPTVEHFSCMVDLLGRAGQLHEAMEIVKMMPCQPNGELWRSVLAACRKWGDVKLGKEAFECAVRLDRRDAAAYVLMSNIYAAADMQQEGNDVQAMRVKVQARKEPGQSWWTDIGGVVHTFVVGDKGHPDSQIIYAKLIDLLAQMKKEGYVPHLESVLRDIPDVEKEGALCGHSERLALAHALLKTPKGTTIRVVKNLRVCEDCHTAIACISRIERRTIICRDANRFHVFKDGKCSCGDYW